MFKAVLKNLADNLIAMECRYLTHKELANQKKLLIFRKDGLGDFILFYPFLQYYREHFRDYRITLVLPTVAAGLRPLLENFEELVEFDAKKFSQNFFYRRRFIKNLAKKSFTSAIYPVFSREPIADLIISLTGAKTRITFNRPGMSNGDYTQLIATEPNTEREIDLNITFTQQVTKQSVSVHFPTIDVNHFPNQRARKLLSQYSLQTKNYAVIFVGAAARYRVWPEERFAQICDHLLRLGVTPVICGGSGDTRTATKVLGHTQKPEQIVNLTGQTDLADLAHLLKQAKLYFGNETGALHLAIALDTPALCLLGGGVFGRFFPYGNPQRHRFASDPQMTCRGDYWACGARCVGDEPAPCIMGISVENARNVLDELLTYLEL